MSKIVLALGGNALGNTPSKQLKLVRTTSKAIADIIEDGHEVVIVHGNGPQVGMISLAMSIAAKEDEKIPAMPYPECGAMSQGYIGYHLQQAIGYELSLRKIDKTAVGVITQVVVDSNDPAFKNPTKPVGRFYTKEEADDYAARSGAIFIEDSGRGYRQVVASPSPQRIIEMDVIKQLTENGNVVIAVGGGGIPVIETGKGLSGVMAVIDKDKSASKLASMFDADILMILTAVDNVCLNYNTPEEKKLTELTAEEAKQYIKEGQFGVGSMLPKIEACVSYLDAVPTGKAIICALELAKQALKGKSGTIITN